LPFPRRSLVLLILAALLPLLVLLGVLAIGSVRQQQEAMAQGAGGEVRRLSDLLDQALAGELAAVGALAQLTIPETGAPDLARFREAALRVKRGHPLWETVILADSSGHQIVNTGLPLGSPLPGVVEPETYAAALAGRVPLIAGISNSPRRLVALRVPVVRGDRVDYVVTAAAGPGQIGEMLRTMRIPEGWLTVVIDANGRIVARNTGSAALIGERASEAALTARRAAESGLYEGLTLEGVRTVSVFQVSPLSHWSVHIGIPRDLYRAPLVRLIWLIGLASLLSVSLAGVFIWLLVNEMRARRGEEAAREQVRRMEALGRMTGGVAHDFNNLLLVILGNLELLELRLRAAGAERPVAAIRNAAEKAAHLTRELLNFSRGEAQQRQLVDLNRRVEAILGMVRHSLRADIAVELDLASALPLVAVDPMQLDLAILNIAVNARDAMPKGGTLRITTRRERLPSRDGGSAVALAISDTGSGVPEEALPHVFEPFFTTKEVGKGTGLGLSQVYGFAKQSGGLATLRSRVGRGTVVTIYLPDAAPAAAAAPPPASAAALPRRAAVADPILLVDDDEEVRRVSAEYLTSVGFTVAEAGSAGEALDVMAGRAVALVISDLVMPGGMGGLDLAREIRRGRPGVPIILVSGYSDSAAEAAAEGFAVLAKPYPLAALAEAARAQIDAAGSASIASLPR
jgi:signal transduction histidine kinase/ActR/RegA family two-component response regulator